LPPGQMDTQRKARTRTRR